MSSEQTPPARSADDHPYELRLQFKDQRLRDMIAQLLVEHCDGSFVRIEDAGEG